MRAAIAGTIVSIAFGIGVGLRPQMRWMVIGAAIAAAIAAMDLAFLQVDLGWTMGLLTVAGFLAAMALSSWMHGEH